MEDYIHVSTSFDGRCVDLLLTQEELQEAAIRAFKNPDQVPANGQCWSIEKPSKSCSILQFVMGKCACVDSWN